MLLHVPWTSSYFSSSSSVFILHFPCRYHTEIIPHPVPSFLSYTSCSSPPFPSYFAFLHLPVSFFGLFFLFLLFAFLCWDSPWDVDSPAADQEIPMFSFKVYCCAHKSLPLDTGRSQMSAVHTLTATVYLYSGYQVVLFLQVLWPNVWVSLFTVNDIRRAHLTALITLCDAHSNSQTRGTDLSVYRL